MTTDEKKELEHRQRLYDGIKDVKDEYTRKVLYSQFVDMYYEEAYESIRTLFLSGECHRNKL